MREELYSRWEEVYSEQEEIYPRREKVYPSLEEVYPRPSESSVVLRSFSAVSDSVERLSMSREKYTTCFGSCVSCRAGHRLRQGTRVEDWLGQRDFFQQTLVFSEKKGEEGSRK